MTLFEDFELTPIEECITKMRCDVNCVSQTSEQIAAALGTTRERIHQIEASALRKLLHGLETKKSSVAQKAVSEDSRSSA